MDRWRWRWQGPAALRVRARIVRGLSAIAKVCILPCAWLVAQNTLPRYAGAVLPCFTAILFLVHVLLLPTDVPRGAYFACVPKSLRDIHALCVTLLFAHALMAMANQNTSWYTTPARLWSCLLTTSILIQIRRGRFAFWSSFRYVLANQGLTMLASNESRSFFEADLCRAVPRLLQCGCSRSPWLYAWIASLCVGSSVCTERCRAWAHERFLAVPLAAIPSTEIDSIASVVGYVPVHTSAANEHHLQGEDAFSVVTGTAFATESYASTLLETDDFEFRGVLNTREFVHLSQRKNGYPNARQSQ